MYTSNPNRFKETKRSLNHPEKLHVRRCIGEWPRSARIPPFSLPTLGYTRQWLHNLLKQWA